MGTKADFYIKDGDALKWQGSLEWDCSEDYIPPSVTQASCNEEFLLNLDTFFKRHRDVTYSAQPWPWHWPSSKQTDYAYIMVEERGAVYISKYNSPCYTIYDYRNYKKRAKAAKKEGKVIEDFLSFIDKVSPFTPTFPKMKNEQSQEDRRSSSS